MKDLNSLSFNTFQCILYDSKELQSHICNFYKLKMGDLISFADSLNYLVPPLYFNFKSVKDPYSLSFIRFQCILYSPGLSLSDFWNLYQLERGRPNFWWVEAIQQKDWVIWASFQYLNFKSFKDPDPLSFLRFPCILHNSGVHFSKSWNFFKLKRRDLISGRDQFCRKSELFDPPFCISILKISGTKILFHSLDFNAFFTAQKSFCQVSEISAN